MDQHEPPSVRYARECQRLVDSFKKRLQEVMDTAMHDYYQDVMAWADIDADINYKNFLHDRISDEIRRDILTPDGSIYSWAANYRTSLLKEHAQELQNAIIGQLMATIKQRDERLFELENRLTSRY